MAKKTCYRADEQAERKQQERSNLEHMQNNQPLQAVREVIRRRSLPVAA